jgi:hypothetical protein
VGVMARLNGSHSTDTLDLGDIEEEQFQMETIGILDFLKHYDELEQCLSILI